MIRKLHSRKWLISILLLHDIFEVPVSVMVTLILRGWVGDTKNMALGKLDILLAGLIFEIFGRNSYIYDVSIWRYNHSATCNNNKTCLGVYGLFKLQKYTFIDVWNKFKGYLGDMGCEAIIWKICVNKIHQNLVYKIFNVLLGQAWRDTELLTEEIGVNNNK